MTSFHPNIPASCPLPDAVPCECVVFRGCESSPPKDTDFKTFYELGRAKSAIGRGACLRFGVSVFPDKQACEHMLSVFPANGNYVAVGTLTPVHGMVADTPSNQFPLHRTWWPYEGVQRETLFA